VLRRALAELEPGTFTPDAAAALVEELARTENACGAAKIRMARRAAECGAHRRRGFADASDWVASATGTTVSEARRQIDAVVAVEECPETRDALVQGAVSLAQAGEIARAEREAPGCEAELLALGRGGNLGAVRDTARKRCLERIDRDDLYARQRRAREFTHWRDDLGMVRGSFALPPDVGIRLVNRIDAASDRLRRQAKRAGGEVEPRAALAADALTNLCGARPTGAATARSADLVIVCDLRAYRRGRVDDGELCHVVGGGPVPVAVARQALDHDAFLKAVTHDGVKIEAVKHFGRHIPAELRTALELGPLPELDGTVCVEAHCDRRYGLEWDHVDPVAHGGATTRENLEARCRMCHRDKTERDRRAGLLRGDGDDRGPP
jgi:5-methylcytosine-specific restriction endonuclease McrA